MDAEVLAVLGEIRDRLTSIQGLLEPLALPQRWVNNVDVTAPDADQVAQAVSRFATGGVVHVPDEMIRGQV